MVFGAREYETVSEFASAENQRINREQNLLKLKEKNLFNNFILISKDDGNSWVEKELIIQNCNYSILAWVCG